MKYTTLIFSKVLSQTQCLLTNHVSYLEVKEDRCNLMKPLSRIKMYRVEWLGGGDISAISHKYYVYSR